ncbi:MAG: hypothetical protein HYW25_05480 [Candidatus Aenigmarchaeota archaeon]|nr:hypothetical protein [Candidatus Aenigmarchaeota archaeon]
MLWALALAIAGIAGVAAIALYYKGLNEKGRRGIILLIWATLFLGASMGGIEWAFYLLGYNLFTFFAFPLFAYLIVWFAFVVWVFESRGQRKIWLAFLAAVILLTIIALACTNCLATYAIA